ncbi:hypothetical protein BDZ89DRAFT_959134, partial [Hymenopellis radicata]
SSIILCVDTSIIAVGFGLFQEDAEDASLRYPNRFGSIPLSARESNYSQPKLELYGLYRAMKSMQLYIVGAQNLVVEVDATAIKGMLNNPDINPSATINRWVAGILLFTFTLVHVPGVKHGVDGLSRRRPFPEDTPDDPEDGEWLDRRYAFMSIVNASDASRYRSSRVAVMNTAVASMPRYSYDPRNPNADASHAHVLPRSDKIIQMDARITQVRAFLDNLSFPESMTPRERESLIDYASRFFVKDGLLWRRAVNGQHQDICRACHPDRSSQSSA